MFGQKTAPSVSFTVAAHTDTGRVRLQNQDSYGCFSANPGLDAGDHLFIVADGMGGHTRGEEASQTAVQVIRRQYFSNPGLPAPRRLADAIQAANREVYRLATTGPAASTMGTTCTALSLTEEGIHLAHVGDSRAYRIGRDGIRQITDDHTVAAGLLREGVLTADEAKAHPRRHALTRAIGVDPTVRVDVLEVEEARAGEAFMLCSDGLAGVAPEEIRTVVLKSEPQQACERLVQMANERGGHDNTTVLIVRFS